MAHRDHHIGDDNSAIATADPITCPGLGHTIGPPWDPIPMVAEGSELAVSA